jgi:hypothetical protein
MIASRGSILCAPVQSRQAHQPRAARRLMHGHMLYHQAAGMMAVLKYTGFQDDYDNPLACRAAYAR